MGDGTFILWHTRHWTRVGISVCVCGGGCHPIVHYLAFMIHVVEYLRQVTRVAGPHRVESRSCPTRWSARVRSHTATGAVPWGSAKFNLHPPVTPLKVTPRWGRAGQISCGQDIIEMVGKTWLSLRWGSPWNNRLEAASYQDVTGVDLVKEAKTRSMRRSW